MLKSMRRPSLAIALAIALALALPALARAQLVPADSTRPARDSTSCASPAGASYERCALWMRGRQMVRGSAQEPVAKPGFFRPAPLLPFVQGDSARQWAQKYERHAKTANGLALAGLLLAAGAYIVSDSYRCDRDPTIGVCTRSDDNYVLWTATLGVAGGIAGIASGIYQSLADNERARALFWHNARLTR